MLAYFVFTLIGLISYKTIEYTLAKYAFYFKVSFVFMSPDANYCNATKGNFSGQEITIPPNIGRQHYWLTFFKLLYSYSVRLE